VHKKIFLIQYYDLLLYSDLGAILDFFDDSQPFEVGENVAKLLVRCVLENWLCLGH